jgi:hypothetical protein
MSQNNNASADYKQLKELIGEIFNKKGIKFSAKKNQTGAPDEKPDKDFINSLETEERAQMFDMVKNINTMLGLKVTDEKKAVSGKQEYFDDRTMILFSKGLEP